MRFQERLYTVTEYEAIVARYANKRFELINGEIVEKMPTQLHGVIINILAGYIFAFLQQNPIGYAMVEARYGLPDDETNDRIPDYSFVSHARNTPPVSQGAAPYMPDLAVEVQSPNQSEQFMRDKAAFYLEHGTHIVWLIYPNRQVVDVRTPNGNQLRTVDDTLDGGDVLPGFAMPVRDLFPLYAYDNADNA